MSLVLVEQSEYMWDICSNGMLEDLQSAMELTSTHQIAQLWCVHSREEKPQWFVSRCPLLLLLCSYLAWCDYSVKESHRIYYSVIVSWENPSPHWAVFLQIITKMIFIEQWRLEMLNLPSLKNKSKEVSCVIDPGILPVDKQDDNQRKQICPYTLS